MRPAQRFAGFLARGCDARQIGQRCKRMQRHRARLAAPESVPGWDAEPGTIDATVG